MNNEPALCPKCGEMSLIKEVTYGKQVTVGYCAFTKACGYKIDRINRVETPLRAVQPPRAKDREWFYETSKAQITKLSQRGRTWNTYNQ